VSYHEHNERDRARELVARLEAGSDIALVSDAGTPLVSDPGFRLVRDAIERGIRVVPIPGPSAFVAALAASGLPADEFTFAGFLPPRRSARRARLAGLAGLKSTLIFYEAPHRIRATLDDAREILGDRPSALARELTKLYEEFLRGSLSEIASSLEPGDVRGEMVLIVGPPLDDNLSKPVRSSILEEIEQVMRDEGLDHKSALKRVARSRGISRSEAYRLAQAERAETDRGV
jgi:16S rRNA (cytidine1402-2'-O)-methyltransferase